jgi:hypothetical protein
MEIIRKGTDKVFEIEPRNCCFPLGTYGFRTP